MYNLANYAHLLYGAYHSSSRQNYTFSAEEKEKLDTLSREDFAADMLKTNKERWTSGAVAEKNLFAGSAERAKLTGAEITALANKYDLHNLDRETYDSFLDDLADMGAISEWEKGYLGYKGLVVAAYADKNGNLIMNSELSSNLMSNTALQESKNDLVRWLNERAKCKVQAPTCGDPEWDASSKWAAERENEMFAAVSSIVNRIAAARGDSGEDQQEESDIVELIRDPNSTFYQDMYARMKLQLEESEEEKKKQAIIDALDAILESLSAKKDEAWKKKPDSVTSMAELSQVIDSLDKDDPRKEQLNLLRQQMQNLGIYIDLDVGVKGKDQNSWGTTLTQQLIQDEAKEPDIFDFI